MVFYIVLLDYISLLWYSGSSGMVDIVFSCFMITSLRLIEVRFCIETD